MKLWELIKPNKKDVFQEYADNMQPLQPNQVIEGDNGQVIATPVQTVPQRKGLTLAERLFGASATPTDNIDPNAMNATISENPIRGGLLNDIAAGARENYTTGFAAPNLYERETPDGRNKGFAYRLGEGLGSVGRVLQSPLGRGLLTAGIVGATGGNGLQALAYGGQTGLMNQNLRNADNLYRQQLKDNYGYTDDQLNAQKGYIDANTFNNLTKSQNSAMNLALKQQATQSMNKLRELQAEKLRIQNSTLPELEKAKLQKAIAEAEHAEEMTLAKINYYNNSANLGWANFGLRQNEYEMKLKQQQEELETLRKLLDDGSTSTTENATMPKGGTTKSGNKWKEVD